MLLDGIAGMKFLFEGQPKHTLAIVKAHFVFYHLFLNNYRKRTDFQLKKYYYTKNIVFNYFVNKQDYFSKINSIK
jgi:hypothetical protein